MCFKATCPNKEHKPFRRMAYFIITCFSLNYQCNYCNGTETSLQKHKSTPVVSVGKAGQVWCEYKNANLFTFSNYGTSCKTEPNGVFDLLISCSENHTYFICKANQTKSVFFLLFGAGFYANMVLLYHNNKPAWEKKNQIRFDQIQLYCFYSLQCKFLQIVAQKTQRDDTHVIG